MSRNLSFFLSLIIYLAGIFSLFLFDLLVARNFSAEVVANWGQVKSFMMILGPCFLVGLNSLVVRKPEMLVGIARSSMLSVMLSAVILVLVVAFFDLMSWWAAFAVTFFSINLFVGAIFRAHGMLVLSQVTLNAWKGLVLVVGLSYALKSPQSEADPAFWVLLSVLIGTIAPGVGSLSNRAVLLGNHPKTVIDRSDWILSIKFFISALTAAASVYLEVLIISKYFQGEFTRYFSHYTVFTSVALVASGFVGFWLTPEIRKRAAYYEGLYRKYSGALFLVVAVMLLLLNGFLVLFFSWYYSGVVEVNGFLVLGFGVISYLRVLYVIPTAYLGGKAMADSFDDFLWVGILSVLMMPLFFYGFLTLLNDSLVAMVLASLINWVVRVVYAFAAANRLLGRVR